MRHEVPTEEEPGRALLLLHTHYHPIPEDKRDKNGDNSLSKSVETLIPATRQLFTVSGQRKVEYCPFPFFAFRTNFSPVAFDDFAHVSQTNPGPLKFCSSMQALKDLE